MLSLPVVGGSIWVIYLGCGRRTKRTTTVRCLPGYYRIGRLCKERRKPPPTVALPRVCPTNMFASAGRCIGFEPYARAVTSMARGCLQRKQLPLADR